MSEGYCFVVDSACDLPPEFMKEHGIEILPISVRFGSTLFIDNRDPDTTMDLYRGGVLAAKGIDAETVPYNTEQITELFENRIAPNYEGAQVITITSTRSPMFENARQAAFVNLPRIKIARQKVGKEAHFTLRVMDSRTLFTGQGVLLWEAVRLLEKEKIPLSRISTPLEQLRNNIYAYLVPNDLHFVRNRGKKKGDKSVGWLSYRVGSALNIKPVICAHRGETKVTIKAPGFSNAIDKLLNHTADRIKEGLRVPVVVMSYAGDPVEIKSHPTMRKFEAFAKKYGIETVFSVMSTTAAINVGAGAFSLAYAA